MNTFPPISLSTSSKLAYHHINGGRDLRLDFLRGLIMLMVIIIHMEYYSVFSMFVWERIGLISSAEGFVVLSGIVLGIVYKKRLLQDGFKSAALKLWERSFQLYRVNLFVILSIAVLNKIPFVNVFDVTHWVPVFDQNEVHSLYPPAIASWLEVLQQALLLRIGPHQFQVIGLYVGLIAIAPLVLYCLYRQKTVLLMVSSCIIYWLNQMLQLKITGARFEFGFPILTWQLLFINGMVIGYHSEKVLGYITKRKNGVLIVVAGLASLIFLFVALNKPSAVFWPWQTFSSIDPIDYHKMYLAWFQKTSLGLGRVINNFTLYIVFYYVLSHYWLPLNKAFGWLLIPLGQASLYVFIVHVYFIILVSNSPLPGYNNFFINTAIHAGTILLIWIMVKQQMFFKIIPR